MSNPEVIAGLCDVIERMTEILQTQAMELAQLGALGHEEEIEAARTEYTRTIGEEAGP